MASLQDEHGMRHGTEESITKKRRAAEYSDYGGSDDYIILFYIILESTIKEFFSAQSYIHMQIP